MALVPDRPGPDGFEPVLGPLVYRLDDLDVRGSVLPATVTAKFFPAVDANWKGRVQPRDYPSVFSDRGACSPHRHGDDALCLYHPLDRTDVRWTSEMGLDTLFDMASEHLFLERYWRDHGVWLGEEAPHGRAA